jgi:predicted DCC family thiol-disulfide oxidoreductase YuxK
LPLLDPLNLDGRLLVLFDGHCGLCNRSIRWFLVRDSRDRLRFAPSDFPGVAGILALHDITFDGQPSAPNTILVVRQFDRPNEAVLTRSDAVLAMLRELPRPWPAIAAVFGWIPRPLRDLGYRIIARWRYRIWGSLDSCPIPTPSERAHFL